MNISTAEIMIIGIIIAAIAWAIAFIIREKEQTKRVLGRSLPKARQEYERTTPPTVLTENLHKVWQN